MSSRGEIAEAFNVQGWTAKEVVRELALILSASAGIIALLMLLKGLQSVI